jgi:hypothetical protein
LAKIVARKLRWNPSPGATGYKIYFGTDDFMFRYDGDSVDVELPPVVDGKHEILVTDYEQLSGLPEGIYDLAVTAYDEAGNESDFAEVENVPLDFVAPAAPTGVEVVAG